VRCQVNLTIQPEILTPGNGLDHRVREALSLAYRCWIVNRIWSHSSRSKERSASKVERLRYVTRIVEQAARVFTPADRGEGRSSQLRFRVFNSYDTAA